VSSFTVKTNQLTKRYGDVLAVDCVDLRVRQGEIYGFLGLNGADKAEMLKGIRAVAEGEANEMPPHEVYLDAFWIDRTEVTNAMYAKCAKAGRCNIPSPPTYYYDPIYADRPVVFVSWTQAHDYCTWTDRRLPTEAEWEKAASWNPDTNEKQIYPWTGAFDCTRGNFGGRSQCDHFSGTSPVGSFPKGASPYGVFDMAGNVWEWIADRYSETYYVNSPSINPPGPPTGEERVYRGGAWNRGTSQTRSTYRNHGRISNATEGLGFRCADSP
jgi:eukaryotic-like serine/threonine-protein kinase